MHALLALIHKYETTNLGAVYGLSHLGAAKVAGKRR